MSRLLPVRVAPAWHLYGWRWQTNSVIYQRYRRVRGVVQQVCARAEACLALQEDSVNIAARGSATPYLGFLSK
jgi:hypothetical protein